MPATEEDDGGDGAQQKQQEEEGTLDAIGSQQDQKSRGDHGAGEAGAAPRRGWRAAAQTPRGAHAGVAGTGERGSARHARRTRPCAQPNGCAPRASRSMRVIQGAGSACHDSADGDKAGTWRQGASPFPPLAPPPPSVRSLRAQSRRGRGGRGGAARPSRPPGPCASSCGRR